MMMPRKKRRALIITLVVFVILVIVAVLVTLYITTDMFKSNSTLFKKYIDQGIENIENIYISSIDQNDILKENKYTTDTNIKINYTQNIGTTLESAEHPINKLKLEIEGLTDLTNNYNFRDIVLKNENKKASEIKLIQENNTYGVEFSDSFKQYVSVENKNLKQIFKQAGFTEEQLENIPDKLEFNNNFFEIFNFTNEELLNIKTKYLNIIANSVLENNFSKAGNQTVKIDENAINTNAYILTLTKEQLNNIYIKLLEELKQDEIILSKLDKIDEMLSQYKFISENITNIREAFVKELQYTIDDITRNNIGQEQCKITVYESKGTTVKTVIQGADYEINIDILTNNNQQYLTIASKDNEKENILTYKKINDQTNIILQNTEDEETSEYNILLNKKINGNNIEKDATIKYEDDTNKVEMTVSQNINIVQAFEDEITLNDENSANLSNLQPEQVQAIIERVNTALTERKNEIETTIISADNLKEILVAAKLIAEGQTIQETGITETEKNRFNSNFEILKGENLDSSNIINIVNAVKDNLIDLEVVSNTELKLKIDRYDNDQESVNVLTKFLEENHSQKYNVEIEYDEETGLVSDILLTIVK